MIKIKILIFSFFLCFAPASVCGQSWKWTTETVDNFGAQASVAVDNDQNLHVSYFSGDLKYGFRPANTTHWFTMDLAPGGGYSELFSRIALDAAGNPNICFAPGVLKFASFQNHRWDIQTIDPQSGLIEYTCSIGIAADGTRNVTWYQYGNPTGGYYLHVKHAVLQQGTWIARTIDYGMQSGKWNCIALDSQGNPHVTYDVFTQGQLKYAYWDGKDWHRTVIDSPDLNPNGPSGGMGNSLVLNREGKGEISYENGESLKFAREYEDGWKSEVIENITVSGSWRGYRTRLALDPQGNPHIAYESGGAVKHAYWDGSNWRIQVISPAGTQVHRYVDLAIDKEGNLYIIFQDALDSSLKIATGHIQTQSQNASNEKKP